MSDRRIRITYTGTDEHVRRMFRSMERISDSFLAANAHLGITEPLTQEEENALEARSLLRTLDDIDDLPVGSREHTR